jgi:uncharacterized protein with PIN domain
MLSSPMQPCSNVLAYTRQIHIKKVIFRWQNCAASSAANKVRAAHVVARSTASAPTAELVQQFNDKASSDRLDFSEEQALSALRASAESFKHPVFPCALIAGDVVILHLLHKAELLGKSANLSGAQNCEIVLENNMLSYHVNSLLGSCWKCPPTIDTH